MRRGSVKHHHRTAMAAVMAAGYLAALPAPTAAADEGLAGTIGDWVLSVCEGGLYQQGGTGIFMPGASNGIRCTSRKAVAGRNYMVLAGYYGSNASANQDLALARGSLRLGPHAQGWDPSTGQLVMFALKSTDPAKALVPLESFGFAVSAATQAPTAAAPTQLSPAVPDAGPIGRTQQGDEYLPSFTCNYDVLCDAAGNVIQGPESGVRLGSGSICAGNGCTRP